MKTNPIWIACLASMIAVAGCQGVDSTGVTGATEATSKAAEVAVIHDAAVGKSVTALGPPNSQYPAKGVASLVDGATGSADYQDAEWMGWWYEDKPFEATVDLGRSIGIESLGVHTLSCTEAWIFHPRKVEFEVSDDGETFTKVATIEPTKAELENEEPNDKILRASNLARQGRYVRVKAQRYGALPEWHIAHGGAEGYEGEAWLFLDEILVNPK